MIEPVRFRWEFELLRTNGRYRRSGPLGLRSAADDESSGVRVAFAIGRSVGTAVVRNRVRRRLRASLGALDREGRVASGRYLIIVSPDAANASFSELHSHLTHLVSEGA